MTAENNAKYRKYGSFGEFFREAVTNRTLSMAYAMLIQLAIIDVLGQGFLSVYTLGIIFGTVLFNIVCDFTKRTRLVGKLVYVVLMYIVFNVMVRMVFVTFGDYNYFMAWFFGDNPDVERAAAYTFVCWLGFCFFISSVVFYFSEVTFRRLYLLLIGLIPCVLYVKREQDLPYVYMVLLIGVYLLLTLRERYKSLSAEEKLSLKISGGGRLFLGGFAAIAVILGLIVPKSEDTPYKIDFDKVAEDAITAARGTMSSFTRYSGNADFYSSLTDRQLYYVYTDNDFYLKRQVFTDYNGERWDAGDSMDKGISDWRRYFASLNYKDLRDALRTACTLDPKLAEKYGIGKIAEGGRISDEEYRAMVIPAVPSQCFVSPLRTVRLQGNSLADKTSRTVNGEMYCHEDGSLQTVETSYSITYYSEYSAQKWASLMENSLPAEDMSSWKNLLIEADNILRKNKQKDMTVTVEDFLDEYYNAEKILNFSDIKVSDNMKALAREITANKKNAYDKALALQNYFVTNGFEYDLGYRPPQGMDTPDYFVFTSKKGTCSDFATAFCLMASAVGLPVRYAEGYTMSLAEEQTRENISLYIVKEKNSHAFPEVYISGTGWMTFEPTVPSDEVQNGNITYNLTARQYLILGIFILLGTGTALFSVFVMPKISEKRFRKKAAVIAPEKAVVLMYNRMLSGIRRKMKADTSVMSSGYVKGFCRQILNTDISPLTTAFERSCYGEKPVSEEERTNALVCYERVSEAIENIKEKKQR